MRSGDPQVARRRHDQPAPRHRPAQTSDSRLGHPMQQQRNFRMNAHPRSRFMGAHRLGPLFLTVTRQIIARTETAPRPRQNDTAHRRIDRPPAQCQRDLIQHSLRNRVQPIGPVQRQRGDPALDLRHYAHECDFTLSMPATMNSPV